MSDATITLAILGVAGVLFASGRVRLDLTALLVALSLMLSGVLTPAEALSGFGDPVVLLVAALIVVGEALTRTGVAFEVGRRIMQVGGGREIRLLLLIMLAAGLLGGVMSSTAVVAIFLPVVGAICVRDGQSPSRLLMPLSFAALCSGMLTLIGTTPNLIVSAELQAQGFEPLGFFALTPVGGTVLAVAMLYMAAVGRHWLPRSEVPADPTGTRTFDAIWRDYGLENTARRVAVPEGSTWAGLTLAETRAGSRFGVRIVGIERTGRGGRREDLPAPGHDAEIHAGDVLLLIAPPGSVDAIASEEGLRILPTTEEDARRWKSELGIAVVLVHPESDLLGRDLREAGFRSRHDLHVLGLRRRGALQGEPAAVPLESGDALLVLGRWSKVAQLREATRDFVVMALPRELSEVAPARRKAPLALAALALMIGLCVLDVAPVVAIVLATALFLVGVRCLSMDDAYRAMPWSSLVLIAGVLPVADALQKTGVVDQVVESLLAVGLDAGPYAVASLLFFLTAALGLVLSNAASAVLVAPVAVRAAAALGVSPEPMAMAVAIAASAAFLTPVSTPVVTLVVAPGGYGFADFLKVGTPMLLLTWLTTLTVLSLVAPF
jgi:di/tricarboxylate transporter